MMGFKRKGGNNQIMGGYIPSMVGLIKKIGGYISIMGRYILLGSLACQYHL
jgi:hypothetical protein